MVRLTELWTALASGRWRLPMAAVGGAALFLAVVAVSIDAASEGFRSPGTSFLRVESFRTAETPFRGGTVSYVRIVSLLAIATLAAGVLTVALRSRVATIMAGASLLVVIGLVATTALGGFSPGGFGAVPGVSASERFLIVESGTVLDTAGELPFGATSVVPGSLPDEIPELLTPDTPRTLDLRQSRVAPHVPVFRVSGAPGGLYLRHLVMETYDNGIWRQDTSIEYQVASKHSLSTASIIKGALSGDTITITVAPLTQMAAGDLITPQGTR
ncbi:MAG: hypothetical protein FJ317_09705, partial [SAR202 cluster bacterium]|nr:hypothetical protein [SAR202 cluster bacterium]